MAISSIREHRQKRSKDFGRIMREWRTARGWSGVEFSNAVGIEPSMISRYESGERTPTYERAVEIARFMYPDDESEREKFVNAIGYTLYRNVMADEDIKAFASMLTRGNVPEEYKQSARAMVRSLVRLTNGYR